MLFNNVDFSNSLERIFIYKYSFLLYGYGIKEKNEKLSNVEILFKSISISEGLKVICYNLECLFYNSKEIDSYLIENIALNWFELNELLKYYDFFIRELSLEI